MQQVIASGAEGEVPTVECMLTVERLPPALTAEMARLVRGIAIRIHSRLPTGCGIERADLIQAGSVGLLKAIRTFEVSNGAPLAAYATFRIRGEMLDMLRRNNMGLPVQTSSGPESDEDRSWEARLPASPESSPHSSLVRKQRASIIGEELRRLPDRYRTVVRMRYSRELTLRQIGTALSVNESRASQLHRTAIDRLRRALLSRGVRGTSHL